MQVAGRVAQLARAALFALALASAYAPGLRAQDPAAQMSTSQVAELIGAVINLTLSEEISGSSYRVENDDPFLSDSHLQTYKVPWSDELEIGSAYGTLHVSAVGGLLLGGDEIHAPTASGLARARLDWTTIGLQVGTGWTLPLGRGWSVRPGVALALAHLHAEMDFNAAGAIEFEPLIADSLEDWDAWATTGSLMLTLERPRALDRLACGCSLRSTWSRALVFDVPSGLSSDYDSARYLTLRGELGAPTEWRPSGRPIAWDVFADWNALYDTEDETLGFDEMLQLGSGLRWQPAEGWPAVRVGLAWLTGPDLSGWSLGVTLGA
jgi:hypothetical protein